MTKRTPEEASPLSNVAIAESFGLLADLLEIGGESAFRVRAYRRAAETLAALPEPLAVIRERGELKGVPGVGPAIAEKIEQLLETGQMRQLEAIKREVPAGVAGLLAVANVGPKRAGRLHAELGVTGLDELRAALDDGRVAALLGAGEARRIGEGLGRVETGSDGRFPLGAAHVLAHDLLGRLREAAPGVERAAAAGSLRRCQETVGDVDLVAAAAEPEAVVAAFAALPDVLRVEGQGPTRCRVILANELAADLWVLPPQHWGALLVHVTGDRDHDIRLRNLALARGGRLSEYGYVEGDRLTPFASEGELYAFFGMQWVPPPMRSDAGEVELALKGALPAVVRREDLRGDLHAHSDWSDGTRSLREMALAARDRGHEYLAITDHSRGLAVANGLDADRLRAQRREIDQVNAEVAPFRLLQGVELEVRGDGGLDLPDDVLAELDLVVAAVHSGLGQTRERLTGRALAAIRHPLVDILAHPTGRIVGGRPGGDFDVAALVAEAARVGTVLEIDGDPARLDLRDVHAREALAAGCTLSIDSDAHSAGGLDNLAFGVGVAQRAWVPPARVLNTLPLDAMLARLKRNQGGA